MIKKILIIVSFILFTYSFLACVKGAGEMVLEWNYSFNVSSAEIANGVAVDSDKNIIVAGYDADTTNFDDQWKIMKFDLDGVSLWNYTANPITTDDDWARGVAVDSDNNIIVVGYDADTTNFDDQWRIMKFDPDGKSLWNYTANPSTARDQAYSVAVDSDKNITVVGYDRDTPEGYYQWRIMKFDPDGKSLWNYTANPSTNHDQAFSVALDSDKNIIVVGTDRNTFSPGGSYQWRIMKLDPDGKSLWNYTVDPNSSSDQASGVAVDSDKNITVVGYDTNTTNFDDQWRIMKFDPDGKSLWNYTFNPSPRSDQAYAVAVDSLKNIIVVGYDDNTTVNNDYQWRIMKFDPEGNSIWNYTINISDRYDRAYGVAVDSDDSFTVVGYDTPTASISETEWIVMKFTLCGNGVRDIVEKCDYSDPNPDGPCESYQYCNNVCQCHDLFDFWVEPNQMLFTIAQKTPVNLYIKNTGYYTDSYDVEAINPNPAVIDIDISGSSPTKPIDIGTTELVRPWVTVLATTTSDEIIFNVTSSTNPEKYRTAILSISEGLPISLYEFSILSLIILMVLAGIVYFYVMKL